MGPMPQTLTAESETLRAFLPSIVNEIVAAVSPVRIILFGSVARGDAGPDSDIDLFVVLDHLDRTERAHLMGRLSGVTTAPAAMDILVTDAEEWERRKDVVGSMHYWPSREGEVIYERSAA